MHTVVSESQQLLEQGRMMARQIQADENLSDSAKARIMRETRQIFTKQAREHLADALTTSQKRQSLAQAALLEAQRKAGRNPDVSRQLLIEARARAAEGNVQRLTAICQECITLGDADMLAAVNDFVLPRLQKLVTVPDGSVQGDKLRPGTFRLLEAQVSRAIADAEPAEMADARAELAAAEDDLTALMSDTARVNQRHAETQGGVGPFADLIEAPAVTSTGGPDLPGPWVITGGSL